MSDRHLNVWVCQDLEEAFNNVLELRKYCFENIDYRFRSTTRLAVIRVLGMEQSRFAPATGELVRKNGKRNYAFLK